MPVLGISVINRSRYEVGGGHGRAVEPPIQCTFSRMLMLPAVMLPTRGREKDTSTWLAIRVGGSRCWVGKKTVMMQFLIHPKGSRGTVRCGKSIKPTTSELQINVSG